MRRIAILHVLALALVAAACGIRDDSSGQPDIRIVVVTHGQSADPFWSVVANGVRDAASDMGVRVAYQAPGSFDMVEMSNLIDAAVASRPEGLVVSIPDAGALAPSIRAAVAAGIPVISINSGSDVFSDLGLLTHIGLNEYEAGVAGGARIAEAGVTRALCVNQEIGNVALDLRCQGLADALEQAGGSVEVLAVDLADPDDAQQRVAGALQADPTIDGILTLGPMGATPTLSALKESNRLGDIAFATFDLSPEVLRAVRDAQMLFAIDQQQYLQGYLAIVLLTKFIQTGALPGAGRTISTGPGFVTMENAEQVISLSERGVR